LNARTDAPRSARCYWVALLEAILLLLALYLLYSGWQTYRHVQSLRGQLAALREIKPATLDALEPILVGTQSDLAALRRDLALPLAIAPHLGWVPRYGTTIRAAPKLLAGGEALLEASVLAWEVAQEPIIAVAQQRIKPAQATAQLAEQISAHQSTLQRAAERARQGREQIEAIDASVLIAPLDKLLAQAQSVLPLATAAFDALPLWPRLARGEQTYLVLAQNNDELRATGGFISSIGAITLREGWPGKLSFRDSYAIENWDVAHPDPPDALRKYMELDLWATRDANWWPDFPTSAQAVLDLYQLNQNIAPNGVLALDVAAAARLVDALAPLEIPGQEMLKPGQALERFRQSWGLSPDSLVTEGVVVTATRPYTGVEIALQFNQQPGQVWFDTIRFARTSAPGVNLAQNASFEDDANGDALPDSWEAQGLIAGDGLTTERAHSGARSFKIVGSLEMTKTVAQQLALTGAAGDTFILAAESAAAGVEADGGDYRLVVTFHYTNGTSQTMVADFPPFTHDWATAGTAHIIGDWWTHRKDFMNLVMQAAIAKLASAPADVNWPIVLSTLTNMLEQRHIQFYSTDSAVQAWIEAQAWGGALTPGDGDYLLLVDSNVGFNKATASIAQTFDYQVIVEPGSNPRARFTVRYRHLGAPRTLTCDKFSQYAPTYDTLLQGCYWDYVRLYAPSGAELIAASGGDEPVETLSELGLTVFATSLMMRPGEERTLVFEYHLPDRVLQNGAYRLIAQKQAGSDSIPLRLTLAGVEALEAPSRDWTPQFSTLAGATYSATLLTDHALEITIGD